MLFHSTHSSQKKIIVVMVFLGLFVIRISLLALYGPLYRGDSYDYIIFADIILNESSWLHDAALDDSSVPVTAVRVIGYPVVIAISKLISADYFDYIIIVIQSFVSVSTSYVLFRLGTLLSLNWWAALLGAVLYSNSTILLQDLSILTDSLFSNIFILVISGIGFSWLGRSQPNRLKSLALGTGFAVAMLLREATLYMAPFVAVGVFLWSRRCEGLPRQIGVVMVFLFPVVAVWQGHMTWNEYRTGVAFFTTGGQNVFVMPSIAIEMTGKRVLPEGSPFLVAFRATEPVQRSEETFIKGPERASVVANLINFLKGPIYPDNWPRTKAIIAYMFREQGLRSPEMQRLGRDVYFHTAFHAPNELIRYAIAEFWPEQMFAVVDFKEGVVGVITKHAKQSTVSLSKHLDMLMKRNISSISFTHIAYLFLDLLGRLISITVFLAAACYPLLFIKVWLFSRNMNDGHVFLLFLWFIYLAFTAMYSLTHLETRYTIAVQSFAIIFGLVVLQSLLNGWARFRHEQDHSRP